MELEVDVYRFDSWRHIVSEREKCGNCWKDKWAQCLISSRWEKIICMSADKNDSVRQSV